MATPGEYFDVVIVGAGISGVNTACRLKMLCPEKTFVILEAREQIGGTWDLWRYPGCRIDSDMFTYAYPFKLWDNDVNAASGATVLDYVKSAVEEYGINQHVRVKHRLERATYSSTSSTWTVESTGGLFSCSFLNMCAGYYQFDGGHVPEFAGMERYKGQVVHPMAWPADLQLTGKRVVVIGSGATAISLVPELAKSAAHVTMLQRSPSYIVSSPSHEGWPYRALRGISPALASRSARLQYSASYVWGYGLCKAFPSVAKSRLIGSTMKKIPGQDIAHFTPRYNPWDQRVCRILDDDLYHSINDGRVSVVTDRIREFSEQGISLASGEELKADLIITATGFNIQKSFPMGQAAVNIDGKPYQPSTTFVYKGMMLSGVPNFAFTFGYTNASWTLKSDLTAVSICRILSHMASKGYRQCCPRPPNSSVKGSQQWGGLQSGYLERSKGELPMYGDRWPWHNPQYHFINQINAGWRPLEDGTLEFVKDETASSSRDFRSRL